MSGAGGEAQHRELPSAGERYARALATGDAADIDTALAALREEQTATNVAAIEQGARENPTKLHAGAGQPRGLKTSSATHTTDWRSALRMNGSRYIGDEFGVMTALRTAPELRGLVRYDEFSMRVELTRAPPWRHTQAGDVWNDSDDVDMQAWLQSMSVDVRARCAISDTVPIVARDFAYHPVRRYLRSLLWDGSPRLDTWVERYLECTGPGAYLAAVGRRWLISAVARIEKPGCQVDHTLVIEGPQGAGKSQAARILAVRPEWYTDRLPDLHTPDAAIQLTGRWIVELAELASIRHTSSIEAVKAFLTRESDVYRPPYGRRAIAVPRQSVFVGTTNESEYLRDRSGNRRYWPVRCGAIDREALTRDRDQLWAEAYHAYQAGERWHLDQSENELALVEQSERVLISELEHDVAAYLDRMTTAGTTEVEVRRVLIDVANLDITASDYAERAGRISPQVVAAMERAGWRKARTTGRGQTRRTVYRRGTLISTNS